LLTIFPWFSSCFSWFNRLFNGIYGFLSKFV
jgi:hypothetical protein